MEPLAVDLRETARLTSLSVRTLRRYIRLGRLPVIRAGRRILVTPSALRLFLEEGTRR